MSILRASAPKEPELKSSIALVEGTTIDNSDFGSGFLIYKDPKGRATYWLTCAHVVKAIGDLQGIRVGRLPATLVGPSKKELFSLKDSFDLAVLRVEGLFKKKQVSLGKPRDTERHRFLATGHFQNTKTKQLYLQEVSGTLSIDHQNIVSSNDYAWVLDLEVDDKFTLEPGYSGSPVFMPNSRKVIGVIEQSQISGKKGQAISIDAAINIFRTVEELRPMLRSQVSQSFEDRFLVWAMGVIEHPLRWMAGSQVRETLDWLLLQGICNLARKAREHALGTSAEVRSEIEQFPEKDRPQVITNFQWEIEKYLERIYGSLLTDNQDLLERNEIAPSLSSNAYECAFSYIRDTLPESLSGRVRQRTNHLIDVLIQNLYADI